jgi:hypothetical protein
MTIIKPTLNILVSYVYFDDNIKKILKENEQHINLYIDSGAFTAYNKGKVISVTEYMEFLASLDMECRYFSLDVIGDADKTFKNYLKLKHSGFNPIPIFTRGAKPEIIDEYYKHDSLLALGGISIKSPGVPNYVKFIMNNYIKGRNVHWLGWGLYDFVMYYKPFSLDSSSWLWGQKFGDMFYVNNNKLVHLTHQDRAAGKIIPASAMKAIKSVLTKNEDLYDPKLWSKDGSIPIRVSAKGYVEYTHVLKKKLNTNMYLACSNAKDISVVVEAFKTYLKEYNK